MAEVEPVPLDDITVWVHEDGRPAMVAVYCPCGRRPTLPLDGDAVTCCTATYRVVWTSLGAPRVLRHGAPPAPAAPVPPVIAKAFASPASPLAVPPPVAPTPTADTPATAAGGRQPIPPRFAASWLPPGRAAAAWFQPFASRVGRDWVVGVRFAYDAVVVAELKTLLRQLTPRVADRSRSIYHAGGWLSLYRCWFVEPAAWPDVHQLLARHGYTVHGPGPHPHP